MTIIIWIVIIIGELQRRPWAGSLRLIVHGSTYWLIVPYCELAVWICFHIATGRQVISHLNGIIYHFLIFVLFHDPGFLPLLFEKFLTIRAILCHFFFTSLSSTNQFLSLRDAFSVTIVKSIIELNAPLTKMCSAPSFITTRFSITNQPACMTCSI